MQPLGQTHNLVPQLAKGIRSYRLIVGLRNQRSRLTPAQRNLPIQTIRRSVHRAADKPMCEGLSPREIEKRGIWAIPMQTKGFDYPLVQRPDILRYLSREFSIGVRAAASKKICEVRLSDLAFARPPNR
jgi:hypothetical protein